ncbi:MAG: NAD(P)H-hydrate dehydratase [Actinobacteria bacterium]|nr:NAD(P)H-hydrate dehydratase [Actinomycetota bacterium]
MIEFEPLYTADEMRAAEARYPGTVDELMERAGSAVARIALELHRDLTRWTVVCGGGANGGDGRIAARALARAGKEVRIVDAKAEETDLGDPEAILDALFGTGFAGEPRPAAAALIEAMNAAGVPLLAVDLPSGVDASTGEVAGPAVRATASITFHGRKVGHVVAPGRFHAGAVHVVDIGLERAETGIRAVTVDILRDVPRRREGDTKYTAGHVLVVGGSPGLTGAPSLAAMAAMRADAGYVTLAAPESTLPVFEQRLLEVVKRPLPDDLGELAAKASSLAIGPGLGRGDGVRAFVRKALAEIELPAVVDADALFGLEPGDWPAPRVLTPHEGEMAGLLGRDSKEVAAHRIASVREAVERFDCVVLLKGQDTLVAAPGRGLLVCSLGLPSLATAGTGDVLTGILGAFLAKGMDAHLAAAAATAAQQRASVEAPQRAGLIASDLIETLPRVLR